MLIAKWPASWLFDCKGKNRKFGQKSASLHWGLKEAERSLQKYWKPHTGFPPNQMLSFSGGICVEIHLKIM